MDVREAAGWVTLIIIGALAGVVLVFIIMGRINLTRLISEPTGDASMSRFQLLIFFPVSISIF